MSEREAASKIARYFLSLDGAGRLAYLIGLAVGRDHVPNSTILRLIEGPPATPTNPR